MRFLSAVDAMRDGIDRRIRAVVPGDAGAIASALITGKRDSLSASVNDAMYVSGLAHVLSISGYHRSASRQEIARGRISRCFMYFYASGT